MKKNLSTLCSFVFISFVSISLSGCQVIGDIFKAGIWVGVIIVIAVLALIALIIKSFKK